MRLVPHVCRPDGTGNRPSPAQLKPTDCPTLYSSFKGCTVMPSGRSGGRHTLPGTPDELTESSMRWFHGTDMFTNSHLGSRLTKTLSLGLTPHSTWQTVDELVAFQIEPDEALKLLVLAICVIWLCFLGE